MSAGRRWSLRFGLTLMSVALSLLLSELVARMLWVGPPEMPVRDAEHAGLPTIPGLPMLYQPNLEGVYQRRYFRTNRVGFRGADYSEKPAADTLRILVTGDSVTMGSGVNEEDAYPARLERRLNSRSSGSKFEVINTGLAGVNISGAMRRLGRAFDAYGGDMAVYGYTVNDIEGDAYRERGSDEERMALVRKSRRFDRSPSYLLRLVYPHWAASRDRLLGAPASVQDEVLFNYFENPEAWQEFKLGLDQFRRFLDRRGICGAVLIHTHLTELGPLHPFSDVYQRVEEAAAYRDLPVIQSYPFFRWRRAAQYWVAPLDPHPNSEGHAILAEALDRGLEELPARCWAPHSPPASLGRE